MACCTHRNIEAWATLDTDEPVELWSCRECRIKFTPLPAAPPPHISVEVARQVLEALQACTDSRLTRESIKHIAKSAADVLSAELEKPQ